MSATNPRAVRIHGLEDDEPLLNMRESRLSSGTRTVYVRSGRRAKFIEVNRSEDGAGYVAA